MRDFTLTTYKKLLHELLANGYSFQTLQDFIQQAEDKTVILRHDVDRLPGNALVIAKIEREAGIKASYYFRIVKESYDEDIIRQIAEMGHEIGYHYENLAEISRKSENRGQRSEVRRALAGRP
jgi:peptidoglycan/xylan/chitin deacetylase (PgdA/CDA1 family)